MELTSALFVCLHVVDSDIFSRITQTTDRFVRKETACTGNEILFKTEPFYLFFCGSIIGSFTAYCVGTIYETWAAIAQSV